MTDSESTATRRISRTSLVVALALCLALAGCGDSVAPPSLPIGSHRAATHVVAPGETIYHIATEYGVSVGRLMAANGINDPRDLRVGQVLTIPGGDRGASIGTASSGVRRYTGARSSRQFQWPVQNGVVSSGFGIRNGAMHDGVDIAAPAGTPVYAADSGVVIFSGTLHGYGNTVIIRHDDDYATVYGHNERNLVSEGTRVARGQEISEIGRSGRTTGANLHFEVRRDNVAENPLAYLPDPASSDRISFAAAGGS
ncbi:peptidoglycan DD-metalloendopeptidase family protein [Candidatus Binatus sp.]|uniref:peptidoglycan DD-metalloendopeptidase family protein n=1 Tax=Candidatus Binatus sp. TaxID=2811406 RepID=UPI003CC5BF27